MTAVSLVVRCTLVVAGCGGVLRGAWLLAREPLTPVLTAGPSGTTFEEALTALCAVVLLVSLAWLLGGAALAAVAGAADALSPQSRATGVLQRWNERLCPAAVRRLVVLLLGLAVGAGLVTPLGAGAATGSGRAGDLDGLAVPDRTTGSPVPAERPTASRPGSATDRAARAARVARIAASDFGSAGRAPIVVPARASPPPSRTPSLAPSLRGSSPRPDRSDARVPSQENGRPPGRHVIVTRGDSLWQLSAHLLPGPVTDAAVAATWPGLYQANRAAVGPDPDLLQPGTRLVVPPGLARATPPHDSPERHPDQHPDRHPSDREDPT